MQRRKHPKDPPVDLIEGLSDQEEHDLVAGTLDKITWASIDHTDVHLTAQEAQVLLQISLLAGRQPAPLTIVLPF